ncbi:MAG: lamin tail domain-containing protein, partial [Planctomycetes bacterium]|nr:lamin tail domain-containing protein [Planctomycetota bacterium]
MGFSRLIAGVGVVAVSFATGLLAQSPSVVISELLASNRRGLLDGNGNASDWIELHNRGTTPVFLEGWCLTDDRRNLRKWPFPPGIVLPAG